MEFVLDLSRHCIETAIRRSHARAVSDYFKQRRDRETLEAEIELLAYALENLDFGRLRSGWKILAGGQSGDVRLQRAEGASGLQIVVDEKVVFDLP